MLSKVEGRSEKGKEEGEEEVGEEGGEGDGCFAPPPPQRALLCTD